MSIPVASVKRRASVPYWLMTSTGSTTFPMDLLIFLPCPSLTCGWARVSHVGLDFIGKVHHSEFREAVAAAWMAHQQRLTRGALRWCVRHRCMHASLIQQAEAYQPMEKHS